MKTNLKFLLPLLFLITAVIPVFAAFPGSGTREQSREIDLIRENSELSSENGELVRVIRTAMSRMTTPPITH